MYQAAVPAMLSEDEIAKRREAAQGKAALEAMVATGEDKGVSASYSGAERHVWNPEGPLSGDDRTLKSSCEPNQPNQPNPTLTHKKNVSFSHHSPHQSQASWALCELALWAWKKLAWHVLAPVLMALRCNHSRTTSKCWRPSRDPTLTQTKSSSC